eukprot:TRINITY_DN1563_c0_g1_i1.p1 TRINITY_DN1563_c0_g1~~TRINITY_DN1563_c0_g1_i1.p1  ORF type:complete len:232 (-),score=84.46 TRINITY_DN1563_c0_g1_i1:7-645(-)
MSQAKIEFTLIANRQVVLAEYPFDYSPFNVVAARILGKIPPRTHKQAFVYEGKRYSYIADESGLIVMAMTKEDESFLGTYNFLLEIQQAFNGSYNSSFRNAGPGAFNDRCSGLLRSRMETFAKPSGAGERLDKFIESQKDILLAVADRTERLEMVDSKYEDLDIASKKFGIEARKIRTKLWWKNTKNWLYLLCALIFAITLIVTVFFIIRKV